VQNGTAHTEVTDATSWVLQVPPPRPASDAANYWQAELTSRAAITHTRAQLHQYVTRQSLSTAENADIEVLLLTFEELASNAVRHGRSPIHVTVTTTDDGWLIDVVDGATERAPSPAVDRDPALGGLGLHLVASLCADHGWWAERDRKHVWARVAQHSRDRHF
jgi:anti-sigma regulatory factor (Ser/Thr protein kinase)